MQPDPSTETTPAPGTTQAPEAPEAARPVNRALVFKVLRDLERLAGEIEEAGAALAALAAALAAANAVLRARFAEQEAAR